MIEAGSETTSQALNNTIVGLLSNPDAVKKAHEELDRVVGIDHRLLKMKITFRTFEPSSRFPVLYETDCRKFSAGVQSTNWVRITTSFRTTGIKDSLFPKTR
jgi:hypothetical protein